ncbi:iron-sulfur cluster assembly accessory protein [Phenylobacterium sp.]|jgi:iron-sulfur cluster assembly protein|uniref:HesB/IscA family protein n=1 Tax=Phenylobacterium sp. TaxID=1871053 RepID=UPI002F41FE9B
MTDLATAPRARRPRPKIVSLTDAAALRVREIMDKSERPYVGLRVGVKNGGCAGQEYVLEYAEAANPLDEVVEDKGVTILVEPKAVLFLIGSQIDYETSRLASKFVFHNPNETDACGCGESVTIIPAEAGA